MGTVRLHPSGQTAVSQEPMHRALRAAEALDGLLAYESTPGKFPHHCVRFPQRHGHGHVEDA